MKKRMSAAMLAAVLCLSIAGAPLAGAANLSNSTAQSYLNAIEAHPGASYLVDFDGDGSEELLLVWDDYSQTVKSRYEVWSGTKRVAAGEISPRRFDVNVTISTKSNDKNKYLVFSSMFDNNEIFNSYTLKNGKWVAGDTLSVGVDNQGNGPYYYINGAAIKSWNDLYQLYNNHRTIIALGTANDIKWNSASSDIVKSVNTSNSDYKDVLSSLTTQEKKALFEDLLCYIAAVRIGLYKDLDARTMSDEAIVGMIESLRMDTGYPIYSDPIPEAEFTALTQRLFGRTIDYSKFAVNHKPTLEERGYENLYYNGAFYLCWPQRGSNVELEALSVRAEHLYPLGNGRYCAAFSITTAWNMYRHCAVVRKNTDGSWTLVKLYRNAYVPTTAELNAFVQPSTWAKSEVEAAEAAGLLPALTGDPSWQDNANRLQFAQLAVRLAETASGKTLPAAPTSTFTDCKDEAVRKAYAAGIVSGTSATTFSPNDPLTREQLATMLWRTVSYVQKETGRTALTAGGSLTGFTDAGKVSSWAKEAVTALAMNNIMKGTSATTLSPKNPCTVEQSILLCYRVYQVSL